MAFQGYYLKFGAAVLPPKLLISSSYSCTPDQAIIIDSFVDADRTSHRDVSASGKTLVTVQTKDYLTSAELLELLGVIKQGVKDDKSRIFTVEYWNPLKGDYATMDAFLGDIDFVVLSEFDSGQIYSAITLTFEQNRG